ncbi:DNA polymerase III subunit delta [Streptococcus suis]|nr:DNA polymerase III subunit delta [Streptococcus suis]
MIAMEEVEQLSLDNLPPLSVVTGDDIGQYELLKSDLLRKIDYDPADLNMSYFDLSEVSYSDAAMDLESLSFFSEEKVVLLDYFLDLTTSKKSYLSEQEMKQFETYIANPIPTTRLVIFAPGKLDGRSRIVKRLKRDGQLFEATPLKEADLRTYMRAYANNQGLHLDAAALEALLVKSSFDFSDSLTNLAFLKTYKKQGHITLEDIQEALPKSLQDNIFDLTKLILKRDVDAARELVRDLRLQGEDEIKLIAVILGQFRLFLQITLLVKEGKQEPQIVQELSELLGRAINPYQVKYALRDATYLSLAFLQTSITTLIETDYQIKQGLVDKAYLFDIALLKMMTREQFHP